MSVEPSAPGKDAELRSPHAGNRAIRADRRLGAGDLVVAELDGAQGHGDDGGGLPAILPLHEREHRVVCDLDRHALLVELGLAVGSCLQHVTGIHDVADLHVPLIAGLCLDGGIPFRISDVGGEG